MSSPEHIRSQMLMKQPNRMLKTFLSAAGASALVFSFIDLFYGPIETKMVGYNLKRQVLGGILLGLGMNAGGACPGTVLAQIGNALKEQHWGNFKRAIATLLGSFAGAALFSSQHDRIRNSLGGFGGKWTLMDVTGVESYWKLGFPFAAIMYGIVLSVSNIENMWNSNLLTNGKINKFSFETLKAESLEATETSAVCGTAIGLLQAPFYIFGRVHLGTSTTYVTLIEPFIRNAYTESVSLSKNAFQVLSNLGIVMGSYFASSQAEHRLETAIVEQSDKRGVVEKYWRPFISGALLVGGARLMGGCTSGHGLSGMGLLSIPSFIAVASMFGAGIAAGHVENYFSDDKKKRNE
uniref:Sulphur transport domain-containing protein n=1 Tax=Percolomonas cosmopolitus TaxID=63605 RepID=A0A7S1KLY3_9EUKA